MNFNTRGSLFIEPGFCRNGIRVILKCPLFHKIVCLRLHLLDYRRPFLPADIRIAFLLFLPKSTSRRNKHRSCNLLKKLCLPLFRGLQGHFIPFPINVSRREVSKSHIRNVFRKNNTFQRRTISKCFLIYFSNTNGKFYILQFFASVKYSFLNRNNPCFNYNVCKTFASFKCTLPDRINPLFYLYFFQRSTSIKSLLSDTCKLICLKSFQRTAAGKTFLSDTYHPKHFNGLKITVFFVFFIKR